ncbi:hypothetical protein AAG570_008040 [Ranatra chinensis]|uniref:Endonuclease/exonuclease/phosphatase domain-containing protein n=1 Tax=Ranatra chinensis TaxID=642074 RepID=A0ABD0XTK8_9HEMI
MLYRVINQSSYNTISPDNPTYWPTHPNRLPDVLDFFIASGLHRIHSLSQVLNDPSSDHSPVLLNIPRSNPRVDPSHPYTGSHRLEFFCPIVTLGHQPQSTLKTGH